MKIRSIFKLDTSANYNFNKIFETNINEIIQFTYDKGIESGIRSENPFLGKYIDRLFKDNDSSLGLDETSKCKNDPVSYMFILAFLLAFP